MCGELTSSSTFTALQDSVSTETLTLGRIQILSFSTVFIDYSQDWLKEQMVDNNVPCMGSWLPSSLKNTQSQFLPLFFSGQLKCSNSQLTFKVGQGVSRYWKHTKWAHLAQVKNS